MRLTYRAILCSLAIALALLPGAVQASAGYDVRAHCDAMRTQNGIAVVGSAVVEGPTLGTYLACRVFVNGVEVGIVGGAGAGPAAVAAGTVSGAQVGEVTACAEVWYMSVEGSIPERPCV